MTTDLTAALSAVVTDSAPTYRDEGSWTLGTLREYLDRAGIKYHEHKKPDRTQLDISVCPVCGETEGNPAAWVWNGQPSFKCLRANKCGATWRDLHAKLNPSKLPLVSAYDLPAKYPHPRPDVVCGLIRRGDVAGIVGGPKARKSWFMAQVAISVAAGIPFLKWPTVQGRVLIVDNELRGDDLSRRLTTMVKAMSLKWDEVAKNIDVIPLRGRLADLYTIRDELVREPERYSLTIVDAIYKAMPRGLEENSNSDMTSALVLLDEAAERHNCGLAFAHHLSKGNQAGKAVTDLGSGAGAQSRSVDVHLAMVPHEDDNTVILQGVLRSQPPFAPICLEYRYPLWHVAEEKDPTALANPTKKPVPTLDAFVATIPTEPTPKKEALKHSTKVLCTSVRATAILLGEAVQARLVEVVTPSNPKLPHTVRRVA
jgi:hypothetical protein